MVTLEELKKAIVEACELHAEYSPSWNVEMACSVVAEDYGMNDTEYCLMYSEVDFNVFKNRRK